MAAEHLRALGESLRLRREELSLTQEEVARRMPGKVAGSRISLWERGKNRPHDDSLEELAKALETTVAALLMREPDKSKTPDPFANGRPSIEERLARLEAMSEKSATLLAEILALLQPETLAPDEPSEPDESAGSIAVPDPPPEVLGRESQAESPTPQDPDTGDSDDQAQQPPPA